MKSPKKIVLAYSGGLDTTAMVPWLIENYGCEIICAVGDVGQDADEVAAAEAKALASGAAACHVLDLRHAFIEDYVFPTLLTGGVYEGSYLLGTATARPVIGRALAELAVAEGADALAHGCTGKGNDQVRFEAAWAAFAPSVSVIAPWRIWSMTSREELLAYIAERGLTCDASPTRIYSRDENLWHISHEGGELEDPWCAPPAHVWQWTVDPADAPAEAEHVTLGFKAGRPRTLNGKPLGAVEMVTALNEVAGRHGVGRIDIVENRLVGMKSRGCYETPAGTVIIAALRSLEELVLDRDTQHEREKMGLRFADLVYDGKWFTPLRVALSAAAESIATTLTGDVVVRLSRGVATVVQRRSPHSLYSEDFATFGEDNVYDQHHAEGFIRLYTLPTRIAALKAKQSAPLAEPKSEPESKLVLPLSVSATP